MGEDRAKIIGSRLFAGPFLRARSITAGLTRSNRPGTLRSVLIGLATPGSADMLFLLVFAAHRLFGHLRSCSSDYNSAERYRDCIYFAYG